MVRNRAVALIFVAAMVVPLVAHAQGGSSGSILGRRTTVTVAWRPAPKTARPTVAASNARSGWAAVSGCGVLVNGPPSG